MVTLENSTVLLCHEMVKSTQLCKNKWMKVNCWSPLATCHYMRNFFLTYHEWTQTWPKCIAVVLSYSISLLCLETFKSKQPSDTQISLNVDSWSNFDMHLFYYQWTQSQDKYREQWCYSGDIKCLSPSGCKKHIWDTFYPCTIIIYTEKTSRACSGLIFKP